MIILPGSTVRLNATFAPGDDLHTVPSEVTLTIRHPSGQTTTITSDDFTIVAEDRYRYDYTPSLAGSYTSTWTSSGTVNHVLRCTFTVNAR